MEGLMVLRDNIAYGKCGIILMLAPRSAKALQEKVLLKVHGIRKLPGSSSLECVDGMGFLVYMAWGLVLLYLVLVFEVEVFGSSSSSSLLKSIGIWESF
ncbi:hypothetical protein Tco_0038470 [Tanacetum coccineum]